jgi:hypothetical protein
MKIPEEALILARHGLASQALEAAGEAADWRLIWQACGREPSPTAFALCRQTELEEAIRAAWKWRKTNRETASRRLELAKEEIPEFNQKDPKWLKKAAKKLKALGVGKHGGIHIQKRSQTTNIEVFGEIHSDEKLGEREVETVEKAISRGLETLTVEEPQDGAWKPLMEFLLGTKKTWRGTDFLNKAREENIPVEAQARIAAMALAWSHGIKIAFVDMPKSVKKKQNARAQYKRMRRISHGDPYDKSKPESVLGGWRAIAADTIHARRDARKRSKWMASAILEEAKTGTVLHLGGANHRDEISEEIGRKTGRNPILSGTNGKENPIAQLFLDKKKNKDQIEFRQ